MSEDTTLIAEPRENKRSAFSRNMRREGKIPAIVYNSKTETDCILLSQHDFEQMLHHHKSETLILDLKIGDGASKKVLLKDVQHHPVTDMVLHADFMEISMTDKMIVPIPLEIHGDPIGVKQGGGVFEQMLREIEVECLPTDLVESIDVDVSNLAVGESLLVKDLVVDAKFTVITDENVAIATVAAARIEEESQADGAAAGEEGAEPERVVKEKASDEQSDS